jgi:hypothetical protein
MSGAADWKRSAILIDWEPDVQPGLPVIHEL